MRQAARPFYAWLAAGTRRRQSWCSRKRPILMVYCTWADPGSVHMEEDASDIENGMQRAHWSWQYARHVRRYDRYCKWLKNTILVGFFEHVSFPTPVGMILPNDWFFSDGLSALSAPARIGLRNHREFVIMVAGLVLISVLGMAVDIRLGVLMAKKGGGRQREILVALRLGYSIGLLYFVCPIFKIGRTK